MIIKSFNFRITVIIFAAFNFYMIIYQLAQSFGAKSFVLLGDKIDSPVALYKAKSDSSIFELHPLTRISVIKSIQL